MHALVFRIHQYPMHVGKHFAVVDHAHEARKADRHPMTHYYGKGCEEEFWRGRKASIDCPSRFSTAPSRCMVAGDGEPAAQILRNPSLAAISPDSEVSTNDSVGCYDVDNLRWERHRLARREGTRRRSLRSNCFESRLKEARMVLLLLFGFDNVHDEVLHVIGRGFIEVFNQFVDLRSLSRYSGRGS